MKSVKMAYRGQGGQGNVLSRPMDGGDPRTPMAWQHRDQNTVGGQVRGGREGSRQSPGRNGGYTYREGGSHTPGSRRAKSQVRKYADRLQRCKIPG